jgi:drug/metabolite transporter superfamily protein YnfA
MFDVAIELWRFLRNRKKYWLIPIFVMFAAFGLLLTLGQTSIVGPFLYALF